MPFLSALYGPALRSIQLQFLLALRRLQSRRRWSAEYAVISNCMQLQPHFREAACGVYALCREISLWDRNGLQWMAQVSSALHEQEQTVPSLSAHLHYRSGVVPWEQARRSKTQRRGMGATKPEPSTGIRKKPWVAVPGDTLLDTEAPIGRCDLVSSQVCCLPGDLDQGCCAETQLAENERCSVGPVIREQGRTEQRPEAEEKSWLQWPWDFEVEHPKRSEQ